MKIRRNDICPCGSGLQYKQCCEGKVDWPYLIGRPISESATYFSLRGRNLNFLNLMFEALEIDPTEKKSLLEFKRAFTPKAVRKIYENVSLYWPGVDDYERCLSRESKEVSGLYTGSYEPNAVCKAVSRHSLYSNKILLTDPFLSPKIVRDEFNPLIHPEKHRVTCLMNATLWLHMAPWIAAGVVNFVRPIRDFHFGLWGKFLQIQKDRIDSNPQLSSEIARLAKESAKQMTSTDGGMKEYHMLSQPDEYWREAFLSDQSSGLEHSSMTGDELISYIQRRRENHPYYLDKESHITGQFVQTTTGSCYEEAKAMCQIGNIHMITDLKSRWMEYEIDRKQHGSDGQGWAAFAKTMQGSKLKVLNNIPLDIALQLREQGRLENMRGFLRRIWQASKSGDDLSEENSENFSAELGHQIAEANDEFQAIDRNLLKWLGGQAAIAASAGEIGIMPALTTSAITGAVGLFNSRMQRKSFSSRYPAGFFLNIKG